MREEDILVVREISLFSTMSDEHFGSLLQMAHLQLLPNQVQLTVAGDPADYLHIVVEGTVELFSKSGDRETTMFIHRPVSACNLSSVLYDTVYLMSARTLDRARVLMIPAENVRKAMEVDPAFAHAMMIELATRYRGLIKAFKDYKLRSGLERLANYLLRANKQASADGQIELSESKHTIAAILGVTPEYLSRAFGTLKQYGVEVHGNKISLTNLDALVQLAKPDPLIDDHLI